MNLLQHIPQDKYGSVLVTLNPPSPVKPDTIVGEYDYEHPYFSTEVSAHPKYLQMGSHD